MQEYSVEPDFRTFLTAIYAYGQLKIWSVFDKSHASAVLLAAKFHTVTPTSQTAMAKAFGSIKSVESVDQITTAIHSGISPFGIVYDLINGFRNLGDGESIKYLIRWLEERDQRVVMATYRHLVMAYHIAEDFDNAWKCTKSCNSGSFPKYILERVENYPIEAAILAGEEELRTGVQVKYSNLHTFAYHLPQQESSAWVVPKAKAALFAASAIDVMRSVGIQRDYEALALSIDVYGYLRNLEQVEDALENIQILGYNLDNHRITASACRAYIFCGYESIGLEYFDILSENSHTIRMQDNDAMWDAYLLAGKITEGDNITVMAMATMLAHLPTQTSYRIYGRISTTPNHPTIENIKTAIKENDFANAYTMFKEVEQKSPALLASLPPYHFSKIIDIVVREKHKSIGGELVNRLSASDILELIGDPGTVHNHLRVFKDNGGVLTLGMYVILMQMANSLGNYKDVIKYHKEMQAKRQMKVGVKRLRLKEYAHVVWAYVNAGDAESALAYVLDIERRNHSQSPELWFAVLVAVVQFSTRISQEDS
ncbi:hypothetical protein BSLG_005936 [Batrachochytrium salamandrivorans]|nr:hypothetical protein BSLG_005936 [Batrachochytrium salamandrivorans]